jgi:hypothetical protein
MVSGWWLVLVFVIGAYAGIALMAVIVASSRRAPQPDALQFADASPVPGAAAARQADEAASRANRDRRPRKRSASAGRGSDPLENQATFQW